MVCQYKSTNLKHLLRIRKPTAGLFNCMTPTEVIGTQEARRSRYLADCAVFVQLNYKSTGIVYICEGTAISLWTASRSNSLILLRYSLFFSYIQSLNVFEGGTEALSALQCAFRLVEDETAWWIGAELWLDSAKGREPTRPPRWFFRQADCINKFSHQCERDGVNIQITGQWQEQKEPFHNGSPARDQLR